MRWGRPLLALVVPVLALVAAAAVFGTSLGDGVAPANADVAVTPIRIMPLGASITYGTNSTDGNGYREELRRLLVDNAGLPVDFVGSMRSGKGADRDNEGHPGFRIDQVAANVDRWLAAYEPDVVLLNVGTNDTVQNHQLATAPDRLRALIDRIIADDPTVTVVFSTLVPSDPGRAARVQAFNARLPAIAQSEQAAGRAVYLVDLNSSLTAADIGPDGTHPTDRGYRKLGDLWYAGLQAALGGGRDWPLFKADFDAGSPPLASAAGVAASTDVAHHGRYALKYSGNDTSRSRSYSYNRVFDVHVPITAKTTLCYWIYPHSAGAESVALDLSLTDGRTLHGSGAVDQYGVRADPRFQGQGGHLVVNRWNLVQVSLSKLAGGTVDQIRLGYDQPANTGVFRGYIDDIQIVNQGPVPLARAFEPV